MLSRNLRGERKEKILTLRLHLQKYNLQYCTFFHPILEILGKFWTDTSGAFDMPHEKKKGMIKDTENFVPNVTGSGLNQDLGKYLNNHLSRVVSMKVLNTGEGILYQRSCLLYYHLYVSYLPFIFLKSSTLASKIVIWYRMMNVQWKMFCFFSSFNVMNMRPLMLWGVLSREAITSSYEADLFQQWDVLLEKKASQIQNDPIPKTPVMFPHFIS